MAKASTAMTASEGGNVTAIKNAAPPADLMDRMAADAGKGVSTASEDNVIPLVYSLQEKTKYCKENGPDYIQGAKPGMIMLRNSDNPLHDGAKGILFQLCYFSKEFVEWVPRSQGGGIVGRFDAIKETVGVDGQPSYEISDGRKVRKAPHPENPKRTIWKLENGNELVETRNHMGFVITEHGALPYAIPMKGADHNASKTWMTLMNNKVMPANGLPYASWAHYARVKTKPRTNASGDWFGYDVTLESFVPTREDYDRGAAMHAACAAGHKRAAIDEESDAAPSNTDPM